MRSKRILHCIPSMGGGGAERQLTYISKGLIEHGWNVHVALLHAGSNFERLQKSGAIIHQLSCKNNFDPMILFQLIQTILKVKPHLIQTWLRQMDIFGGIAAIIMKRPFVVTERSCSLNYGNNWKNFLRILVARRAVAMIANSKGGKTYWADKVNHSILIRVIRNSIPFDEIAEVPIASGESMGIEPENEIILFAGRFSPEKNLSNLLNAIRQVLAQRTKSIAILFGDGPILNDVISMQIRSDINNRIRVIGFTPQFWDWLKRANVFVSVSLYEGHPNTVLEATACKCPVVVSDIPAHREFLDEKSAYFVSPFSPGAIAETIVEVLSNPKDAMIKAWCAFNKISQWSIESVIPKYADLYHEILWQQAK